MLRKAQGVINESSNLVQTSDAATGQPVRVQQPKPIHVQQPVHSQQPVRQQQVPIIIHQEHPRQVHVPQQPVHVHVHNNVPPANNSFINPLFGSNSFSPLFGSTDRSRYNDPVVNLLHEERLQRNAERYEDQRRRREKELKRSGPPNDGTLRFLANSRGFPLDDAMSLFYCIDENRNINKPIKQEEFGFPTSGELFLRGLQECQSEAQARRYMVYIQKSLVKLVDDSVTLTAQNKQDFKRLLNTHDYKKDLENAAIIFGIVIFAVIAPTCLMLAAEAKVMECAVWGMFATALTFGPYWLAHQTAPQPYFPEDKGAACEVPAFKSWLSDLAILANRISPPVIAEVVAPPSPNHKTPNIAETL